jgi:hypothetical protein
MGNIEATPGPLAQLAEQGTLNPKVGGSSPPRPTEKPRLSGFFSGRIGRQSGLCPELAIWYMVTVIQPPTGHVYRREGARRAVWYMKYRLPDGRQAQRRLGPAWTGRGRPPTGYFTKRLAEDELQAVLDQARRGTLPGMVRTLRDVFGDVFGHLGKRAAF